MMNRVILIISFVLAISACKEEETYLDVKDPEWLQSRIERDEGLIEANPDSGFEKAAWIRFEWEGDYYFDYINLDNSAGAETYTYDGSKLSFSAEALAEYLAKRCCEHVIWVGPGYN